MAKKVINDFDKNSLIQTIVSHTENLNFVARRVDFLEQKIGNETLFAETFHEAYTKTKKVDEAVSDILIKLLKSDEEIKSSVSKIVNDLDRSYFKRLLKNIGIGVWTIFVIVITVVIDRLIKL